jgi:hypothetical protein
MRARSAKLKAKPPNELVRVTVLPEAADPWTMFGKGRILLHRYVAIDIAY